MKKIVAITSFAVLACMTMASVAFAADVTTNTTGTTSSADTAMLACGATAVATREAAAQSAVTKLSTDWSAALQTRASDLTNAWKMTDRTAMKAAIKDAWKKYTMAQKAAKKTYNDARKAAWNKFSADWKMCRKDNPTS